jgi:hypothetical protein
MRPTPGVDPPPLRSRKSSSADVHQPLPAGPTTFFLASESDIERVMASNSSPMPLSQTGSPSKADKKISRDSTYGVQSLEDALGDVFGPKSEDGAADQETDEDNGDMLYRLLRMRKKKPPTIATKAGSSAGNTANEHSDEPNGKEMPSTVHSAPSDPVHANSPLQYHHRQTSHTTISQPLTPLMLESPNPFDSVAPSSPKSVSLRSLRLSEDDDGLTEDYASQAIVSSDEDEGPTADKGRESGTMSSSAPELVMPSLAMPSRRPFTARGRQMGRLKVCVAGMKGGRFLVIR